MKRVGESTVNDRFALYREQIEDCLDQFLSERDLPQQTVVDASRYSLLNGGKRLRAILVLEFCRLCSGDYHQAIPFACAIEMMHAYSLIHDDLPCMDDDDLRRGVPSCHVRFGEAVALLAGDNLLTLSFDTLTKARNTGVTDSSIVSALKVLGEAGSHRGMIGGQILDINELCQSKEQLEYMFSLKTGKLIKADVRLGCIAANADEKLVSSAISFADAFSLAYQIRDDLLDVIGSETELGKPIGSDQTNGKFTYTELMGIEQAQKQVEQLTESAVRVLKESFLDSDDLIQLTRSLALRRT